MMECSPCKKTFTESENYEKHLQSQEHKEKTLSVQERQNDLPDESETVTSSNLNCDGAIKCHVCDLSFNSLESFQDHSVTPEHALKVMLKQAASSNSKTTITNHELDAMKYKTETATKECILPELNKSPDIAYGKCDICSKMFSGPEPYKQHIESQAHKKKAAGVNVILKCEPCNKSFSGQVPYAQHMTSEIHKKKVQNIQAFENYFSKVNTSDSQTGINENVTEKADCNKQFFCKICNTHCSGFIPYQQHLEGSTHFKKARMAQSLNNTMAPVTQFKTSKVLEASENATQIVNGSCESHNGKSENDSVFPEKINELKVVSDDEFGELVKIISPDEEIKFDNLDQPEASTLIKQDEN